MSDIDPIGSRQTSGRIEGRMHRLPLRVYFADTDAAGLVYHSTFLDFAERGRTEMLRLLGFDHVQLRQDGLVFVVRHCDIDYLRPAKLDDLLEVRSHLTELGGSTLSLKQTIWRDGQDLVRLAIRLVCVRADGRPTRVPPQVRGFLEDFLTLSGS